MLLKEKGKLVFKSFIFLFSRELSCFPCLSFEHVGCSTLCDPINCSSPGFSVHGNLQTRILEWVAILFFRESKNWTWVSCLAGGFFTVWVTREGWWASQVALVVKDLPTDAADARFNPWVGKMPWNRKWQPALVFLPGRFHGQRSLAGYSPWSCRKSDITGWLNNKFWTQSFLIKNQKQVFKFLKIYIVYILKVWQNLFTGIIIILWKAMYACPQ